ncbi:OLC1v1002716C1 [Oldenlandia corymbosa var. corymbosa]|uniref:OLC1v1002716C1 n=1 Tax=Oldenlandia corymbosa var. corymbosa TaxID=529605 RepID=A0AAV1D937_OLDCO|nr:OLC1v1002716C1 [Oldenlandia corymbosa var. corymbosa]
MSMEMAQKFRAFDGIKAQVLNSGGVGLHSNTLLVIKLPDSRVLQIISRSLFLAIILLTLPSIGSILRGSLSPGLDSDLDSFKTLPILFRDLADEGLLRKGHKGLIVSSSPEIIEFVKDLEFLREKENHNNVVIKTNIGNNNLIIPDETFDFVFTLSLKSTEYADRVLKHGGIVITQLSNDPSRVLQRHQNHRIVYLRRFDNTFVAMRKVSNKDGLSNSATKATPCGITGEDRKLALQGLEDALLEPPRRTLLKSPGSGISEMKFLPDLLGDSLKSYKRRILISDEKNGAVEEWFYKNYPTRNQYFETFNLDVNVETQGSEKSSLSLRIRLPKPVGVSDWLRNNVKREDFVVMKAEAQVVDEMIKDKTICLVDELFLECKNEFQDEDPSEAGNDGKRAYWQCLTLYGGLRDQGVAVHQWWN